jgi:carbonic anhydrase
MDAVLEQLKNGVRRFRTEIYPDQAQMHAHAVLESQRPHTLFITCSDSRVDPIEITQSGMGELFVTRNIGNLVPPYGEMLSGVSAVIEYAVKCLHVQHVVVCGHTDCGAMKTLLHPESVKNLPSVASWLTNALAAVSVAEALHNKTEWRRDLLSVLTGENVLLQLQHLKAHPAIAGAMAKGELTVSGWVYDIGKGQVSVAEDGQRSFTLVE